MEKEELCKMGAKDLAMRLTSSIDISQKAYASSTFTVGTDVHSIIHSKTNGIEYFMNEIREGVIKESAIDRVKTLKKGNFESLLKQLDAEVTTEEKRTKKQEERKIQEEADARLRGKPKEAKLGEKQEEEDNTVFNRFIDEVIEKIPSKTTSAATLTYNFWVDLALQVAYDQLDEFEINEEDGSKLLSFMDEKLIDHEFVLNKKGFIYRVDDKVRLFKGYDAVIRDVEKKRNN